MGNQCRATSKIGFVIGRGWIYVFNKLRARTYLFVGGHIEIKMASPPICIFNKVSRVLTLDLDYCFVSGFVTSKPCTC